MLLKTIVINKTFTTIYFLWWSAFRNRNSALWTYCSRYYQRCCLQICFTNRALCFEKIWMGLPWSSCLIWNWQSFKNYW